MTCDPSKIKEAVTSHYSRLAKEGQEEGCICELKILPIYLEEELSDIPEESTRSMCACGNPTAIADLKPGEVVLDMGSGAGVDVFLAARKVGPSGKVIGIDATDEMIEKARLSARKIGLENVEFRKGVIESLPVETGTVDVIISNCVINLSADKDAIFREAFRVLKPGGRLSISDRVLIRPLKERARENLDLWSACVSGAILEEEYLAKLKAAGFEEVKVVDRHVFTREEAGLMARSLIDSIRKDGEEHDEDMVREAFESLASVRIVARKPDGPEISGGGS